MNLSNATQVRFNFGSQAVWQLDSANRLNIAPAMQTAPVAQVRQAIETAFSQPLDFVPLDQSVVPGDRIVFAVDSLLPQLCDVVTESLCWFAHHGVLASNMTVVLTPTSQALVESLKNRIGDSDCAAASVQVHDPDSAECVAYLAANDASDPIYINRTVVDADVVVPISCATPPGQLDNLGCYGVFPLLSDRATRGRFYSLPRLIDVANRETLLSWANQAAWWLGLMASVQVVPGCEERPLEVFAGTPDALLAACDASMKASWATEVAEPLSEIVVACLDDNATQQSWLAVARALDTASKCVAPGGTIVLCTSLSEPVGVGLSRLRQSHESQDVIAKQLAKDCHDDAIAAAVFLRCTAEHHVYLLSQHRKETLENLGIGFIENASQLNHLVSQFPSCTLLKSAQHAWL